VHLADETVTMVMALGAPGCVVLVTDAMAAAGRPDGRYRLGRLEVAVAGGTARLADGGAIAGGTATLLDVVRRCVVSAGIDLARAVRAASADPAAVLGLGGEVGALSAGGRADVLAVDESLAPVAVWRQGRLLD
jgi:N-acetylglucosamine-6-phosphate deacetylase